MMQTVIITIICHSNAQFSVGKNMSTGHGSRVFTTQGKVIVANDAQKTDGAMKSQAILLSPLAQMNTKPELEIFADDVVCGHGATVGSLDPEQVFYLQTRGIPKDVAEAMLLEAFGREAIDRLEDEMLAEALCASLRAWLASRGATAPRHGDVTTETRA